MTSKIRTLIVALALAAGSIGAVAAPALAQERGPDRHFHDWRGHDGWRGGWYDRWHHFHYYAAPIYEPGYVAPPVVYAPPAYGYAYAPPPVASLNFVLPLRFVENRRARPG